MTFKCGSQTSVMQRTMIWLYVTYILTAGSTRKQNISCNIDRRSRTHDLYHSFTLFSVC